MSEWVKVEYVEGLIVASLQPMPVSGSWQECIGIGATVAEAVANLANRVEVAA